MIAIRIEAPMSYDRKDRPTALRAARTLEKQLNRLDPHEQVEILRHMERAIDEHRTVAPEEHVIGIVTGGRTYTAAERAELELGVLHRSFARRRQLLDGAITAPEVAKLLGTSRQTPHDRLEKGTLLAVVDRGSPRFPLWQFDPEGPDSVVAGLPEVLRALAVGPLAKVSWLTRPNPYLDDEAPIDALKRGEKNRVVALAEAVGVH